MPRGNHPLDKIVFLRQLVTLGQKLFFPFNKHALLLKVH